MSKISIMREMLLSGKFTKEQLAKDSGCALSTVAVQLGYHLRNQGYVIHNEVVDDGVKSKKFWMTEKTHEEYAKEAEHEGEEVDDSAQEPKLEPTDTELNSIKMQGLDKMPADAELEALLDQ